MYAQPTLLARVKVATRECGLAIIGRISQKLLDGFCKHLSADKLSIPISEFCLDWQPLYGFHIAGYFKTQGIAVNYEGDIFHFELPSYAMADDLNKRRIILPKEFESHPGFQMAKSVTRLGGSFINILIEARNKAIASCVGEIEESLLEQIKGRLSFDLEGSRNFVLHLGKVTDLSQESPPGLLGSYMVDHLTQAGMDVAEMNGSSDQIFVTIPKSSVWSTQDILAGADI